MLPALDLILITFIEMFDSVCFNFALCQFFTICILVHKSIKMCNVSLLSIHSFRNKLYEKQEELIIQLIINSFICEKMLNLSQPSFILSSNDHKYNYPSFFCIFSLSCKIEMYIYQSEAIDIRTIVNNYEDVCKIRRHIFWIPKIMMTKIF